MMDGWTGWDGGEWEGGEKIHGWKITQKHHLGQGGILAEGRQSDQVSSDGEWWG